MKKNSIGQTIRMPLFCRPRKILNVMRWNLLFLFFFCISPNVFSQDVKVSLDLKQVSVKEFFKTIQQQTGINFLYNANLVEGVERVTVSVKNKELRLVLEEVLHPRGLTFLMQEGTVVIKRAEKEKQGKNYKTVVGVVRDEGNEPLPGVTVMLKGMKVGTATDVRGCYKMYMLDTTANAVLVYSFVGMETQEIKYRGQDSINVTLKTDLREVEEVVVTGYQVLQKRATAGSYNTVHRDELELTGVQTLEQALQGKIPGMMVMNRSGLTGTRQRIRVRGTSTLLGNAEPVWVVDGIIQEDPLPFETNDLNNLNPDNMDMIRDFVGSAISWLNPNDIETVTVLKDASSTAIYGVEAANGVIVITTKKGKVGRMSISYSGNLSFTPRMTYDKLELMNSKQRVDVSREAYQTGVVLEGNQDLGYTALAKAYRNREISLDEFTREVKKLETNNTDWFDILFRNAVSHNHSIGISGGNEQATYHASFGYRETYNTAKGNEQKQYTGNVSVSGYLGKAITFGTNLAGSVSTTKGFTGSDPFTYASSMNRAIPAYNEDGSRFFYKKADNRFLFNIENELENSGNENTTTSLNASVNLRWKITDWLNISTQVSYSTSNVDGESYRTEKTNYIAKIRGYDYDEYEAGSDKYNFSELPNGGELNQSSSKTLSWSWRNQLSFVKVFNGVHSVNAMFGHEVRSSTQKGSKGTFYGYMPDRGKIFVDIPPYTNESNPPRLNSKYRSTPTITDTESNTLSYYATLSYMYNDRYAINASVRTDASNRFGQDKSTRFQPVWSLGFRWNLGFEPWFQNQSLVNDMSFRASFGYQGNVAENVSPDLIAIIGKGNDYDYTLTLKDLPAPKLKWEKVTNINLGVDFSFLKDKVRGSFEWYYKKTTDMVTNVKVPYENGVVSRPMNGGNMSNHGWDASFSFTPVRSNNWVASMSFSLSKVYNKLKSDIEPTGTFEEAASGNLNKDGYPVTSFWAFKFTGLNPEHGGPEFDLTNWATEAAVADATLYMVHVGKMEPDFSTGVSFSVRYKRLSLSSGVYFSFGNQQFLAPPMKSYFSIPSEYENMSTEWVKRWRKPGDEKHTNVPSLPNKATSAKTIMRTYDSGTSTSYSPYQLYALSDIRVVDAWQIRMNNIGVSYSFPEKSLPKGLRSMSLSFSLSNPFQIRSSDFKGRDPEVALGSQPLQRSMSLSVSVSF